MRVGSFAVARPNYYDRNATSKQSSYVGGPLAPHSVTTRWTYTVPAGKKAYVESCYVDIIRGSAATSGPSCKAFIRVTTSDSTIGTLCATGGEFNTLNALISQTVSNVGLLAAGDLVQSDSYDNSTGGTLYIVMTAKYTQFDA